MLTGSTWAQRLTIRPQTVHQGLTGAADIKEAEELAEVGFYVQTGLGVYG